MSDDELLNLTEAPGGLDQRKIAEKVRNYRRDMESTIKEVLSEYVAGSCYDEAKKALEGATDAFDGMEGLVDDLGESCTAMDDFATNIAGNLLDALNRFAPDWRDEAKIEHVADLA